MADKAETKTTYSITDALALKIGATFKLKDEQLAARVRHMAAVDKAADKAGSVVDLKAIAARIVALDPEAVGVSSASLSKARGARVWLTEACGRDVADLSDAAIKSALRVKSDAPADNLAALAVHVTAAVAAAPENAPAEVIAEAAAEGLKAAAAEALELKKATAAANAAKREVAKAAAEATAEAAAHSAREALAAAVEEVPTALAKFADRDGVHVLDLIGHVAVMLADANDLGTLTAAEGALTALLSDTRRYLAAVAEADSAAALEAAGA